MVLARQSPSPPIGRIPVFEVVAVAGQGTPIFLIGRVGIIIEGVFGWVANLLVGRASIVDGGLHDRVGISGISDDVSKTLIGHPDLSVSAATIECDEGDGLVIVIGGIDHVGNGELSKVVQACRAVGCRFRLGKRWHEHARQNGNDGDDHQQLDERECSKGC